LALVSGTDESWLLVGGSAADQAAVAVQLRRIGVQVVRTGRYLGEAADGMAADWYIRFVNPADLSPIHQIISSGQPGPASSDPNKEPPAELRLRLVQSELAQARAREASLASDLAQMHTSTAFP
jgi:hypothetical protein